MTKEPVQPELALDLESPLEEKPKTQRQLNLEKARRTRAKKVSEESAVQRAKKEMQEEAKKMADLAKQTTRHRYRAQRVPIHHPYQNVLIPVAYDVVLNPDNWVHVQVEAGVIVDCGEA